VTEHPLNEVGVAFPTDEVSAELIASRLRDEGIPARVDRGLVGSYQVMPRNQVTVLVDERHAQRARELLGTASGDVPRSIPLLRAAIAAVVGAIVVGVIAIVALLAR
jgi:hypothetical protein